MKRLMRPTLPKWKCTVKALQRPCDLYLTNRSCCCGSDAGLDYPALKSDLCTSDNPSDGAEGKARWPGVV
jgi:hypothetical protein